MSFLSEFTELLKTTDIFLAESNNQYYFILFISIFIIWKYEFFINIWFRLKNKRLNEFYRYRTQYLSDSGEPEDITRDYLDFKINELIQIRSTRIKNFKERCIFMYIASKPLEWDLGEIRLRRIVKHIEKGSAFFIDVKKYQKIKQKAVIFGVIGFITMLTSIIVGEYFNRINHQLYYWFFTIAPIAELYALYQFDKIIWKKDLEKYNCALLKVNADGFDFK
ncbi:TPA: hypothetical protein ACS7XE_003104 [Providencia alcalifaciens]